MQFKSCWNYYKPIIITVYLGVYILKQNINILFLSLPCYSYILPYYFIVSINIHYFSSDHINYMYITTQALWHVILSFCFFNSLRCMTLGMGHTVHRWVTSYKVLPPPPPPLRGRPHPQHIDIAQHPPPPTLPHQE